MVGKVIGSKHSKTFEVLGLDFFQAAILLTGKWLTTEKVTNFRVMRVFFEKTGNTAGYSFQ